MAADLPDTIVWNRTKLGFGMEEQSWLSECLDLLQVSPVLQQFISVPKLQQIVRSKVRVEQAYWLPLSLGLWLQTAYPMTN